MFLPADTRENIKWQPSPHCQGFGPAVWIQKEAPGNGFLMGSWHKTDELMLRYGKYLLFRLLSELWPHLKQGPNESQLFLAWFTWGGARSLKSVKRRVCAWKQSEKWEKICVKSKRHKISPENRAAWRAPPLRCLTSCTRDLWSQTTPVCTQLQC